MSLVKKEDERKWINAFAALSGVISGFLAIRLAMQAGEWFDLEVRVPHYIYLSQGAGILAGLGVFGAILGHPSSAGHLREVYGELLKVVWPDRDSVFKLTVGIVVGVAAISGVFVAVDFVFQKGLELVY